MLHASYAGMASPTEKRLLRELSDFHVGTFSVVANQSKTHWNMTCTTPLGRCLIFEIDCSYPFKPPVVKQYNIMYRNIMYHHALLILYQKMYKKCGCSCCLHVFQSGSWSPCFTLKKIYDTVVSEEKKWHAVFQLYLCSFFNEKLPQDVYSHIALFM